jgi:hypothetical protein
LGVERAGFGYFEAPPPGMPHRSRPARLDGVRHRNQGCSRWRQSPDLDTSPSRSSQEVASGARPAHRAVMIFGESHMSHAQKHTTADSKGLWRKHLINSLKSEHTQSVSQHADPST